MWGSSVVAGLCCVLRPVWRGCVRPLPCDACRGRVVLDWVVLCPEAGTERLSSVGRNVFGLHTAWGGGASAVAVAGAGLHFSGVQHSTHVVWLLARNAIGTHSPQQLNVEYLWTTAMQGAAAPAACVEAAVYQLTDWLSDWLTDTHGSAEMLCPGPVLLGL